MKNMSEQEKKNMQEMESVCAFIFQPAPNHFSDILIPVAPPFSKSAVPSPDSQVVRGRSFSLSFAPSANQAPSRGSVTDF